MAIDIGKGEIPLEPKGVVVGPPKVLPSWDVMFDVRQPDEEHPNGHYVIHKPTGHQWEKGDLDPQIFSIIRCQCTEEDLPVFQSWRKVMREQYVYDQPTAVVEEVDTVPVEMLRVKIQDGRETRGWYKDVPKFKRIQEEGSLFSLKFTGFQQKWVELQEGKYSLRLTYSEDNVQDENFRIDTAQFSSATPITDNMYETDIGVLKQCLVATSTAEKQETQKLLDTHMNAILTVGTGKTYSTISAAITVASSGDIIECYATGSNTYTENVTFSSKYAIQLIGMVASRGLTITKSSGVVVSLNNLGMSIYMTNFAVVATGTATIGVDAWYSCYYATLKNLYISGGTTAAARGYIGTRFINCVFTGSAGYGLWSDQTVIALYCTATKNSTYGFSGSVSTVVCFHCVAAGNTTADYTTISTTSAWNTSADASANGISAVTGFATTDFVDYAGNDFRLKVAVAGTTKARFLGYPLTHDDAFGNERKTAGVVFAGWSDPDPVSTSPAVPTGLTLTDAKTYGMLKGTITNIASFVATDVLAFFDNSTGLEIATCTVARYNALAYAPICGLTNNVAYTGKVKSSHDGQNFSAFSATATATPTSLFNNPVAPVNVTCAIVGTNLVVTVVATNPTDVIYIRYKNVITGIFSAESETYKRTGSGTVAIPGLDVTQVYECFAYCKG